MGRGSQPSLVSAAKPLCELTGVLARESLHACNGVLQWWLELTACLRDLRQHHGSINLTSV